ncbi:protein SEMI-ROLLED LEAF 2 isoform X2 [Tasmannia lanceolata]
MEAYNKLLCLCKEQMAYFAGSLLNVIPELLDNTQKVSIQILGCQTLTSFIYNQADGMYTHNIESLVPKVCSLAREVGEEDDKRCLRASSLQCLSAMVWFMAQFSHIFTDFDEIVHVTLDNYGMDINIEDDDERGESHHNWVDEVVRCEGRGGVGVGNDVSPSYSSVRPRPEKKDSSILTREEIETPKVWAQICIQKMVELAKESTTLRSVLDPMFIYFDTGKHWAPRQGLALLVLSNMSYLVEASGNEQLILAAVIRHLDHKNVVHDPQTKSDIIQIGTALARQLRSQAVVAEIGVVSDLCRHLRKSLQATGELVGPQELSWNISLQNSIEDCLLEIAKGIGDARQLFDMMAITMEKLPPIGVVARAVIGSLLVLAHIISVASVHSHFQQVFPDALLLQLLKIMMHPDVEARIGAHQIFAALLVPTFNHPRHESTSFQSDYLHEERRWQSKTASAFSSATALLEKLRREQETLKVDKHANDAHDALKEKEIVDEESKHGWVRKNSPNFYKISSSIIDRTAGSTSSAEPEPSIVKLSEDQTAQLLSAFWRQANLSDNLPANFEAIAHSFSLTLLSSHLKISNHNIVVRFFQLPLSIRNVSLDPNGTLPPSCQRSLFTLATTMLMFAAKSYHIPELNDLLRSTISYDIDPYMNIGDDLQVYVKHQPDVREYGSAHDQQAAITSLSELRMTMGESEKALIGIIVGSLSSVTQLEMDDIARQLTETFTPDDACLFSPHSILDFDHIQTIGVFKESLSFDEDFPISTSIEDDLVSESSAADMPRIIAKMPVSQPLSHIISVGQLLESALEVAGQVAGASVSTSPLSYSSMASQCEALGTGARKKLSSWLGHESRADKLLLTFPRDKRSTMRKINCDGSEEEDVPHPEPWIALRLPPASPFDNFLKAAGC